MHKKNLIKTTTNTTDNYGSILKEVVKLIDEARRFSARTVNAIMTATYCEIGRRIVEPEQEGKHRAGYGKELLKLLSSDLIQQFGRGYSERNLEQMRKFYTYWPISHTVSAKYIARPKKREVLVKKQV